MVVGKGLHYSYKCCEVESHSVSWHFRYLFITGCSLMHGGRTPASILKDFGFISRRSWALFSSKLLCSATYGDTVLLETILEMQAELLRLGARQQDKIGKK